MCRWLFLLKYLLSYTRFNFLFDLFQPNKASGVKNSYTVLITYSMVI